MSDLLAAVCRVKAMMNWGWFTLNLVLDGGPVQRWRGDCRSVPAAEGASFGAGSASQRRSRLRGFVHHCSRRSEHGCRGYCGAQEASICKAQYIGAVFQTEECRVMLALEQNGRDVGVMIHDGGLVRNLKTKRCCGSSRRASMSKQATKRDTEASHCFSIKQLYAYINADLP